MANKQANQNQIILKKKTKNCKDLKGLQFKIFKVNPSSVNNCAETFLQSAVRFVSALIVFPTVKRIKYIDLKNENKSSPK